MKHFHFSGKESFLDNRIFDILNLLAENKEDRRIFYGVVSNGMSMDIQGYDEVLATNISYLEISLEEMCIRDRCKGGAKGELWL